MLASTGDIAEFYLCMFFASRVLFLYYFHDCTVFIFALSIVNWTDAFVFILSFVLFFFWFCVSVRIDIPAKQLHCSEAQPCLLVF